MTIDLILGTAGHIDHGKTSLIQALTGTDTDRLPEEKKRGITIELGFAELNVGDFRLGIVDVPGHEKFVRQMLAGATGMDLALLVVAADDSVKPQTREHLDVLRVLDLPAGVIALTKCDVADPDWIDLVEEEIRELVKDTFLAQAPIVRTSAITGSGLADLESEIQSAAESISIDQGEIDRSPFRMAIDRAFTIAGHGTVVTGSVSSGSAAVGDQLMIEPGAMEVRVRGIQNHDRIAEHVHRGQRAAINLAGIHRDDVTRGHELISTGHLVASRLVTVRLDMLPNTARPLKNRAKVRVHIGTTEVLATTVLFEKDRVKGGESVFAQLFLAEPIVSSWNQPFVVRSESPVETIAGGRILVPSAEKLKRPDQETIGFLSDLQSNDTLRRASAAVYFAGANHMDETELPRTAGITDAASVYEQLIGQGAVVSLQGVGQRKTRIHQQRLNEFADRMISSLTKMHDQNPLSTVFERSSLANQFSYIGPTSVFEAILRQLEKSKRVRLTAKGVGLADRGPTLSKNEKELLRQLLQHYKDARFAPPTIKECQAAATKNQKSVPELIKLAASDGDLIEVSADFFLHADVENELRAILRKELAEKEGLTMSEIRELLRTSRKYAVPICEYLDNIGFTKRKGDLRQLTSP